MSEALKLYLLQHRKSDDQKFRADNARAVLMLTQKFGDRPIDLYTREHAEAFRDSIISGNSTGTARRYLNRIAAIFNKARKEKQLPFLNPFEGLGIPGEGKDERERLPFTGGELALISAACRRLDDDIRHIVALQMDTGARAGEIVGLRVEDIVLDQDVAHVQIRPFGRVRTLKTPASERIVPLVGSALWAARSALKTRERAADGNPWLFPRYASDRTIKATHASNTLNKWLRSLPGVSNEKTTHCFRHAMRDRLRAAEVPSDIQDALGGWGTRSVGQQYGTGYPLALLQVAMLNLPLTTV